MRESQFGFEYSWDDLQPIRLLALTVAGSQIAGAILGLWVSVYPSWFANLWAGAALATFPSFLVGLLLQFWVNRASLSEHRVMVRRLGLIALVLSLSVFVVPLNEL